MICTLCPRMCRAQRDETHGEGYCGMGTRAVVARAAPHYWEEACPVRYARLWHHLFQWLPAGLRILPKITKSAMKSRAVP